MKLSHPYLWEILAAIISVPVLLIIIQCVWILWLGHQVAYDLSSYQRVINNAPLRILLMGDSTAVGIGALSNQGSVAGWFAKDFPQAHIETRAKRGLRLRGLLEYFPNGNEFFDLVVLQIGANDILHLTPIKDVTQDLIAVLDRAKALSDHVAILHSGDVGTAPMFIWPINVIFSARSRMVRDLYLRITKEKSVVYVDLYKALTDELFLLDVDRYYARDLLHLSDEGYRVWYQAVRRSLADH